MNRRRLPGVLGAGAAAGWSGERPAESAQVPALAVRIVPKSYREKGGWAIELEEAEVSGWGGSQTTSALARLM